MIKDILTTGIISSKKGEVHFRFYNYLLLNASFTDHPGLINGKGASIVYFCNLSRHWKNTDIGNNAYSFISETLSSPEANFSCFLEDGVAGIGILIAYLIRQSYLDESSVELLEEIDPHILHLIDSRSLVETNLSKGLGGLGLYCLHRFSSFPTGHPLQQSRLKEAAITCVDQINEILKIGIISSREVDYTLLDGLAGTLLFLNWMRILRWYEPIVADLMKDIYAILLKHIEHNTFSWQNLEIYFTLLHCKAADRSLCIETRVVESFTHFMKWAAEAKKESLNFLTTSFNALWLELIGRMLNLDHALSLGKELGNWVVNTLDRYDLGELFPYSREQLMVPIGLRDELCATALPLLSLQTKDYSWLTIIGIHYTSVENKDL